jgi:hypothetical protein
MLILYKCLVRAFLSVPENVEDMRSALADFARWSLLAASILSYLRDSVVQL